MPNLSDPRQQQPGPLPDPNQFSKPLVNPVAEPIDSSESLPDGSSIAEEFNRPLKSEDAANDNDHVEFDTAAKAKQNAARYLDESGFLINASNSTIAIEKLKDYALSPNQSKSRVFKAALGFDQSNAEELYAQLKNGVTKYPAHLGKIDEHGTRFTVDIPVRGPKGQAIVRTGWIYQDGVDTPRLVTLFIK